MKLIQHLPRYQHNDLLEHSTATTLDEGNQPLLQTTTQLINSDDVPISLSIHHHNTDVIIVHGVDERNGHAINEDIGGVVDERDGNNSSSSMKDDSFLGEKLPSTVDPSSPSSPSSIASKGLTVEINREDSDDNEVVNDDNEVVNDDNEVVNDDNEAVPTIDPISALRSKALNNELSRSNVMSTKLDLLLLQISDHRDKIREVLSSIPKLL